MIRQHFLELAANWDEYRSRGTTDKEHPIHELILRTLPDALKVWQVNAQKYLVKGSDGQGNILRTPWIATFNPEITTSATTGFYPVFLFRDDMREVVLELGFGATQFKEKYGTGKTFFREIERAVSGMQASSKHLLAVLHPDVRARISMDATHLNSETDFNLRAYEKCSIYSLRYPLENLPNDQALKFDYLEILKLYDAMAESVLLPSEEAYVLESSTTPELPDKILLNEFTPGTRKKKTVSTGASMASARRYSKSSDKVGRIGEEYVYNLEKELLVRAGRSDLADQVIWHRQDPSNRTPGWDITSFNLDGSSKLIEVKSSIGKTISNITLTSNEWRKAEENIGTNNYQIYIVTKALKEPEVTVLKDPAKWVAESSLELSIESYLLYLGQDID